MSDKEPDTSTMTHCTTRSVRSCSRLGQKTGPRLLWRILRRPGTPNPLKHRPKSGLLAMLHQSKMLRYFQTSSSLRVSIFYFLVASCDFGIMLRISQHSRFFRSDTRYIRMRKESFVPARLPKKIQGPFLQAMRSSHDQKPQSASGKLPSFFLDFNPSAATERALRQY